MKLPLKVQAYCQSLGKSISSTTFATMLNPNRRGTAFTWDKLPEEAAEEARFRVSLSTHIRPRYRKAAEELAATSARYRAEELLRRSDILSW